MPKYIEWRESVRVHSRLLFISSNEIHCGKIIIKTKRITKRNEWKKQNILFTWRSRDAKTRGLFLSLFSFVAFVEWNKKKWILVCGERHANWTANKCQNYTKRTDQILFFLTFAHVVFALDTCVVCMYRTLARLYIFSLSQNTHRRPSYRTNTNMQPCGRSAAHSRSSLLHAFKTHLRCAKAHQHSAAWSPAIVLVDLM